MSIWCVSYPEFHPGDKVASLVIHPPEIQKGTLATVISPQAGSLYAIQLPNGELHRWFAWFELEALSPRPNSCGPLQLGDFARVLNDQGHPPMIQKGILVKIVKVISRVPFYDLRLENGKYHRWLAEFEMVSLKLL